MPDIGGEQNHSYFTQAGEVNVNTSSKLREYTVKELAAMAKKEEVAGWHAMRKEELVRALVNKSRARAARESRRKKKALSQYRQKQEAATAKSPRVETKHSRGSGAKKSTTSRASGKGKSRSSQKKSNVPQPVSAARRGKKNHAAEKQKKPVKRTPAVERRIAQLKERLERYKELSGAHQKQSKPIKDRLIVMVRDPFWLHVYWELSNKTIDRARAAMGQYWHGAEPVLRVYRVKSDGVANLRREYIRDIVIHGGVNNWYIDVDNPPSAFQIEIGYLYDKEAADGEEHFFMLASSNIVETPQSTTVEGLDRLDGNWVGVAEDFDHIFKLSGGADTRNSDLKEVFEQQLRRPMNMAHLSRFGPGAQGTGRTQRHFPFVVDAELIVHGKTDPTVQLAVKGEPVRLQEDGSFSVRFALPEKRQVLPVVASSNDGVETQTIVLAVERNTKEMEPVFRDPEEEA